MLYAHGTSTDRNFDMTNLDNAEALSLAALFASQGFIVVAPNYAGYDTSTLSYHPYLIADQQSKDMIDALSAARVALPLASAATSKDSGALFITGYSQGGYVAMATHRAMQAAGMKVTASAPMSGPYAPAAFVDAVFYGEVNLDATVAATFLLTAYQDAYHDIYASTADVFESPYAASIQTLLPSTSPVSTLYSEGKLPPSHLFSADPPAAEYADITPPTAPADLAQAFALGFGGGNLILNSYRAAYLADAAAHPDGGFPTVTTGVPAAAPTLAWRQALQKNDLRDWVPNVPVQLCGGDLDPDVFWFNTTLMQRYWAAHAAAPPAIGPRPRSGSDGGRSLRVAQAGFCVGQATFSPPMPWFKVPPMAAPWPYCRPITPLWSLLSALPRPRGSFPANKAAFRALPRGPHTTADGTLLGILTGFRHETSARSASCLFSRSRLCAHRG